DVEQGILSSSEPVHAIVGVGGRIVAGIHNRQEIPILVVRQGRNCAGRVSDLRDEIERVVFPEAHITGRTDRGGDSSGTVIKPRGRPAERVRNGNQISVSVTKLRYVAVWIGGGADLTGRVVRVNRGITEGIGGRRKISFRIIGEARGVPQRIGDACDVAVGVVVR